LKTAKLHRPTREAPTRGSVGEYQDWLIEQLKAGVEPFFTGACVNDCVWAERLIEAEAELARMKTLVRHVFDNGDTRDLLSRAALADKQPTASEDNEDCPRCKHKDLGEGDEPCFACAEAYVDTLKHPCFEAAIADKPAPREW
jgi:hypothetical protein